MRREYDFSKGVRGKFYRRYVELRLPVYLDNKLRAQIEVIAKKKGKDVGDIVNDLLRKEIELLDKYK